MEPRASAPCEMSLADVPGVVALLEGAGLPAQGLEDTHLWVVNGAAGHPEGAVGVEVHGGVGLLRSLVVAEHRRGEGVGRALVDHAVDWARRAGLDALYALTTGAAAFLGAAGFAATTREDLPEVLGASAELQGACPATAAVLVRPLEP